MAAGTNKAPSRQRAPSENGLGKWMQSEDGRWASTETARASNVQDVILPAVLFCAAAVIWISPERGLAVLLMLAALAASPFSLMIGFQPPSMMIEAVKDACARHASDMILRVMGEVTREGDQLNRLLDVAAESMRKLILSAQVRKVMIDVVLDVVRDHDLQDELLSIMTQVVIKASADRRMRDAILGVCKEAMLDVLKDENFTAEMIHALTDAAIGASKNKELRDKLVDVVKEGVGDALKDEDFMKEMLNVLTTAAVVASKDRDLLDSVSAVITEAGTLVLKDEVFIGSLRDTICASMTDHNIYRSAASGVVGSLNPFRGKREVEHPSIDWGM